MRDYFKLLAVVALATTLMMVAGCGKKTEDTGTGSGAAPLPTAATMGEQVVLTAEEYLAAAPFVSASSSRGEQQAQVCKACHSLGRGGPNMIGPALYGIFGRKAGTRSGFVYSASMSNADFVWTPEAMNAWLAQPGKFLPGNQMMVANVSGQADRDNLIAYLLNVTTATDAK